MLHWMCGLNTGELEVMVPFAELLKSKRHLGKLISSVLDKLHGCQSTPLELSPSSWKVEKFKG